MKTILKIFMMLIFTSVAVYGQTVNYPPPVPSEEEPEILTSGPVNEAFAQPVTVENDDEMTVPKAPPPDIEENVPAERPSGDQFSWVPGYWAWDSERSEHIWISGCWRAVPPGKYWVPGYWAKVYTGWRWVPGFWASLDKNEIEYLPAPPKVNYVPPAAAYPDKIWVPPCWYWSHGRYTLRSGYWLKARQDWVWVPSHYIWTPRGYIFISGHWDYPLKRRGVLFAPVHFRRNIYSRVRLSYSLSIVLDLGNLEFGLFTRPGYGHYYFGDFYDDFYVSIGIFPWFECETRRTWYDPIYQYDRWLNRKKYPDWWQRERREYARRKDDKRLRPPKTYRDMERRVKSVRDTDNTRYEFAAPVKIVADRKNTDFRFRRDNSDERKRISKQARDVQEYSRERSSWEASGETRKTVQPVKRVQEKIDPKKQIRESEGRESDKRVYSSPEGYRINERSSDRRDIRSVDDRNENGSGSDRINAVKEKADNVKVNASPVTDRKKRTIFKKKAPDTPEEEDSGRKARRRQ